MTSIIFNPRIDKILRELQKEKGLNLIDLKILLFIINEGFKVNKVSVEMVRLLIARGLVEKDYDEERLKLRIPLYVLIEQAEIVSNDRLNGQTIEAFINAHYDEYRVLFSKNGDGTTGFKPGSMGDREGGIKKMITWFKKTKYKYTWEDVLRCAKFYVDDFIRKNDFTYMKQADYFINKDNTSMLSTLIEDSKNYNSSSEPELNIGDEFV